MFGRRTRPGKKESPIIAEERKRLVDALLEAHTESAVDPDHVSRADVENQKKRVLESLEEHEKAIRARELASRRTQALADALQEFVRGGQRTLDQILLSKSSVPFASMDDLRERVGVPELGYMHWHMTFVGKHVPRETAFNMQNYVVIPQLLGEVLDTRLKRSADEFGGIPMWHWLDEYSFDYRYEWAVRLLRSISIVREAGDEPWNVLSPKATSLHAVPTTTPVSSDFRISSGEAVSELLDHFAACAIENYDLDDNEGDAGEAIEEKRGIVEDLDQEIANGRTVLAPLLQHPDPAVKVSAATYLLSAIPERAIPVLREFAALKSEAEMKKPHAQSAIGHAQYALWLHRDGLLSL